MIFDTLLIILAVIVIAGIIAYVYLVLRLDKLEKRIPDQGEPDITDSDQLFGPDPRERHCDRCSEYTLQLAHVETSGDVNNTLTEQLCLECLKRALDNRTI